MKVEEVFKLLDAGFTKADIDKMISGEVVKIDEAEKEPSGENNNVPGEASKENEESENAYEALIETVKDLKATVEAMQKSNIDNANKMKEESKTVEDLVADFTKDM